MEVRFWCRVGLAWVLGGLGVASAQAPPAGASSGPVPLSATNPYMNPYLNPYLNPAIAGNRPLTGRDAAMYLFMANSANGGLGSGRLSGTRPGPGPTGPTGAPAAGAVPGAPGAKPAQGPTGGLGTRLGLGSNRARGKLPVAEMPNSASVPGSGAARFFNPGGGAARGAGSYFGRGDLYFNNNRR